MDIIHCTPQLQILQSHPSPFLKSSRSIHLKHHQGRTPSDWRQVIVSTSLCDLLPAWVKAPMSTFLFAKTIQSSFSFLSNLSLLIEKQKKNPPQNSSNYDLAKMHVHITPYTALCIVSRLACMKKPLYKTKI